MYANPQMLALLRISREGSTKSGMGHVANTWVSPMGTRTRLLNAAASLDNGVQAFPTNPGTIRDAASRTFVSALHSISALVDWSVDMDTICCRYLSFAVFLLVGEVVEWRGDVVHSQSPFLERWQR